jgi:hypothetical protein
MITVRKPERKRQRGKPRYKWLDNIKIDLAEIGCDVDYEECFLLGCYAVWIL